MSPQGGGCGRQWQVRCSGSHEKCKSAKNAQRTFPRGRLSYAEARERPGSKPSSFEISVRFDLPLSAGCATYHNNKHMSSSAALLTLAFSSFSSCTSKTKTPSNR